MLIMPINLFWPTFSCLIPFFKWEVQQTEDWGWVYRLFCTCFNISPYFWEINLVTICASIFGNLTRNFSRTLRFLLTSLFFIPLRKQKREYFPQCQLITDIFFLPFTALVLVPFRVFKCVSWLFFHLWSIQSICW